MACCGIPIIKRNAGLTVGAYMSMKRRKEYGLGSLTARSSFLGKQSDGLPRNLHSWQWVLGVVPVELEHCWGRGPPGIGLSYCPGETRCGAAVAPGLAALSKLWLPSLCHHPCTSSALWKPYPSFTYSFIQFIHQISTDGPHRAWHLARLDDAGNQTDLDPSQPLPPSSYNL